MDGESVHDNVGNLANAHKLLRSIARFLNSVSKHEDKRKPKRVPESYPSTVPQRMARFNHISRIEINLSLKSNH